MTFKSVDISNHLEKLYKYKKIMKSIQKAFRNFIFMSYNFSNHKYKAFDT